MLNLIPPIPYTPKMYRALPESDRVAFWYAAGHEKHEAFSAAMDALSTGAHRYEVERGIEQAEAQRAFLLEQPESPQRSRAIAQIDLQMVDARLVLDSPGYRDVVSLDRDAQHDAYANALGLVVVYVRQGGASQTFPTDHAKRVEFVRGLPPMALIDLCRGIRQQAYDETEAGN